MLASDGTATRPRGLKEVNVVHEVCYCGRMGEVEERLLVTDGDGRQALQCPECGHLDHLSWLSEGARDRVFARSKRLAARRSMPAA